MVNLFPRHAVTAGVNAAVIAGVMVLIWDVTAAAVVVAAIIPIAKAVLPVVCIKASQLAYQTSDQTSTKKKKADCLNN